MYFTYSVPPFLISKLYPACVKRGFWEKGNRISNIQQGTSNIHRIPWLSLMTFGTFVVMDFAPSDFIRFAVFGSSTVHTCQL